MSDITRLIELRARVEAAQRIMTGLGMVNTLGLTAEQRVLLDVQYERARENLRLAHIEYQNALRDEAISPIQLEKAP